MHNLFSFQNDVLFRCTTLGREHEKHLKTLHDFSKSVIEGKFMHLYVKLCSIYNVVHFLLFNIYKTLIFTIYHFLIINFSQKGRSGNESSIGKETRKS